MFAAHDGSTFTTKAHVHELQLKTFEIGHTLPAGATVGPVTLDGHVVPNPDVRQTNRGVEVSVPATGDGPHMLTVTTS